MDASLSWIKAYVPDLDCTDRDFFNRMTLFGTKTETYTRFDQNLEKIVVGRIQEIKPHPDADKLVICQVDVGKNSVGNTGVSEDGRVQIVTGAKNMKEGDLVPVVLDGGRVAASHGHEHNETGADLKQEGIPIQAGKLREVESYGMMCSIEELGSSRDFYPEAPENGLYIFEENSGVQPGDDAVAALGLHDTLFEFEITSNRVDCYAILGIAREAAAAYDLPFYKPDHQVKSEVDQAQDYIKVAVQDSDLCTHYCARICKDVHIAPSPKWMQRRLASCGIRPINNLVDITNYVMLEYGQPMHAYDLSAVAGNQILVRRARDGESFVTLDGVKRQLDRDVLMICDAEKEIGIAGIMGGENSMITDKVHTVLFEAATFQGANIRKSAKRIGLRTDASGFFEKGLDPANAIEAINRACALMEELHAGTVVAGMVEAGKPIEPLRRIPLEEGRINALLGTKLSKEEMIDYFKREEIGYDQKTGEVVVPSFRQDLHATCDLAEEVARFYGYDKIPVTLPKNSATTGGKSFRMYVRDKAEEVAQFSGFSQAYCYSFESPKVFDKLLLPKEAKERAAITISNPLGEDFSIMRTLPLGGILTSLSTNYSRRNKDVRLYEIANIYLPKELPLKDLPDEREQFTLGFYGEGDFYTMKGVVEEFLESLNMLEHMQLNPRETLYEGIQGRPYLHPGRQAEIQYQDPTTEELVKIGYLGELHPLVAANYGIKDRVYLAVIDIPSVLPYATFERRYHGIAKFPALSRDLSMVVPREILAGEIEQTIRHCAGEYLEKLELFDLYEGAQIQKGYKSMAYSLSFRSAKRTLSDEEVNSCMDRILNGLKEMKIELRS